MKIEITNKHKSDSVALIRGIRLGLINSTNKDSKLYGIVSTQLKLEPVDYIHTLCTDGEKLVFNPLFVLGLSKAEMQDSISKMQASPFYSKKSEDEFVLMYSKKSTKFLEFCLMHELDHCIHDHFTRVGTRDRTLFNQAADYRINADEVIKLWGNIEKAKQQEPIFNLLCLKEKYKDKNYTSEKIYDDLAQEQKQNSSQGNGQQDGNPLDDHMYGDKSMGSGKQSDFEKFVREVLGLPDKPINGEGKDGDAVSSPQMNNNRIKEAFIQTAKEIGYGSGGIIEQIKTTQEPVINWKKQLRKDLNGLNKSERDPKKPHRRIHGLSLFMKQNNMLDPKLSMYRAGKKPEQIINVYCLFDTSGSISSKERAIMLSEVNGIMKQYKNYSIHTSCWDTQHYRESIVEYTKKNSSDIINYKWYGNGGTDPNVLVKYLKEQEIKSTDRVIIFSDMYFSLDVDKWKEFSNNTIWMSTTKNMRHATRNIGVYLEYDKYI